MSLFISTENQNILYEMIHKTPEIQKVFSTLDEKNRWFREIIEYFFKQLPSMIDKEMLKKVNRDTLGYMVNSLKTISNTKINNIVKEKPITLLKKEQPIESKQYTSFFDIPKPKVIDFSEQLNDEVITNMDELIEQQKQMRERELQEYAPKPESIKISILEDLPKTVIQDKHVHFEVEQIPNTDNKTNYNVSQEFNNLLVLERVNNIETKIDLLMNMIQQFITPNITPNIVLNNISNNTPNNTPNIVLNNVLNNTPNNVLNNIPNIVLNNIPNNKIQLEQQNDSSIYTIKQLIQNNI